MLGGRGVRRSLCSEAYVGLNILVYSIKWDNKRVWVNISSDGWLLARRLGLGLGFGWIDGRYMTWKPTEFNEMFEMEFSLSRAQ